MLALVVAAADRLHLLIGQLPLLAATAQSLLALGHMVGHTSRSRCGDEWPSAEVTRNRVRKPLVSSLQPLSSPAYKPKTSAYQFDSSGEPSRQQAQIVYEHVARARVQDAKKLQELRKISETASASTRGRHPGHLLGLT